MQYLKLASLFFISTIFISNSFAKEVDENILSQDRLDIIDFNKKQNEENSSKLRKDWINPITLSYKKSYTETYDTTRSMISINQPIFKSGGIYSAIKYANVNYKYNDLDIESQRKELIKQVTTLLFNLHIIDLNIKKNEYLLKNANIDIQRKKEQVLNGFLDTSYLDNAILDANTVKNSLADLYFQKKELENSFNNLASKKYTKFELPQLSLTDKEKFLENSLELAKARVDVKQKDYLTTMSMSQYLPTFSVSMDYSHYHDTDENPSIVDETTTNYGVSVSMPIDVRALNDVQSQRIEYLKAKLNLNNIVLEEQNFYKTKLSKIDMIERKKEIAKEDYKLYDSLLKIIVEEKNAQLKTQSDVDTLANSQKIKSLEVQILELQKQIELLDIYSKII
ncbi:MAG: TolC family protein [Campylobacteraceae bacterium]|nr:TolC family protein [Campylobacteraceae bacterium]